MPSTSIDEVTIRLIMLRAMCGDGALSYHAYCGIIIMQDRKYTANSNSYIKRLSFFLKNNYFLKPK